jgi:hypothetical protein
MPKARIILFVLPVIALVTACAPVLAPTQSGDSVATAVAATMQALTAAAPAPSTAPPTSAPTVSAPTEAPQPTVSAGIPVNYKNVSFVIPSGLATDAAPFTVEATTEQNGGPWGAGPEHIEFKLENCYASVKPFSVCQIDVYPADEYSNQNAGANISLQRLRGLLANPSAPLTNETLPQVPSFNAASMFAAQVQRIHFASGDGVRMVTEYTQGIVPVSNDQTFYHFEGLTSDGNYYVIAVLPVQAPFLQNTSEVGAGVPSGGVPFPGYDAIATPQVYQDYVAGVTDKLNSFPADQFSPSLATLDALIQSLKVTP